MVLLGSFSRLKKGPSGVIAVIFALKKGPSGVIAVIFALKKGPSGVIAVIFALKKGSSGVIAVISALKFRLNFAFWRRNNHNYKRKFSFRV